MIITIDGIFMVLNLAVRVGLVWYLVNKYAIGRIQNLIGFEKKDLLELKQQQTQLRVACNQIEQQMKEEAEMFATLQKKFIIWNQRVQDDAMQEQIACEIRQKKIEAIIARKAQHIQKRLLIKVEIPQVLDHVLQKVEKEFIDNPILGKQYKNKLLDCLKKLP